MKMITNSTLEFVKLNPQRIWPGRLINWDDITFFVVTPRFKASRHVIFLLYARGEREPVAVIKTPRIPRDNQALDREVANLNLIQSLGAGLPGSIPRVLAYEDYEGSRVLVQEAQPGVVMSPRVVRQNWIGCTCAVLDWLAAFQSGTLRDAQGESGWFSREVLSSLDLIAHSLPLSPDERRILGATKLIVGDLKASDFPLVFAHGDLSSPNILLSKEDHVSVVDWELASPGGLPALDLFFFLTYVAFARDRAQQPDDCLASFRSAFADARSWTSIHISRYSRSLGIPADALRPLLVMTWMRCLAGLTSRLLSCNEPQEDVLNWLRGNRYYKIWIYMIEHYAQFSWLDDIHSERGDTDGWPQ